MSTAVVSHPVIMIAARMLTDDESFIVNLSLSASLSSWNRPYVSWTCGAQCSCPQTCDCCCRAALAAELSCSSASRVQFAKRPEAPTPQAEVELLHIILYHNKHVLRPVLYLRTPLLLPGSACLLIPPALLTCRYSHPQALVAHRLRQEQLATSPRRVRGRYAPQILESH